MGIHIPFKTTGEVSESLHRRCCQSLPRRDHRGRPGDQHGLGPLGMERSDQYLIGGLEHVLFSIIYGNNHPN